MPERFKKLLVPVLAVLAGFLLGALILLATGKSPLGMFAAMVQGVSGWNISMYGPSSVIFLISSAYISFRFAGSLCRAAAIVIALACGSM